MIRNNNEAIEQALKATRLLVAAFAKITPHLKEINCPADDTLEALILSQASKKLFNEVEQFQLYKSLENLTTEN